MRKPDELLAELRREVESVHRYPPPPPDTAEDDIDETKETVLRLVSIVQDLDGALSRGGELPKAWAPPGLVRVHEDDLAVLLKAKKSSQTTKWENTIYVTCIHCGLTLTAGVLRRGNVTAFDFLPRGWGTLSDAGNVIGSACSVECAERYFAKSS